MNRLLQRRLTICKYYVNSHQATMVPHYHVIHNASFYRAAGGSREEFVFVRLNRIDNGTTLSPVARLRLADRSCFILHSIYILKCSNWSEGYGD